MGIHDSYGKKVLEVATDGACEISGFSVRVDYGDGGYANIDGALGNQIAIEIESRTPKQVRGAIVDLLFHSNPKKLLVLLPVHMYNPERTVAQCEQILRAFLDVTDFQVVLLQGHGNEHKIETDSQIVRQAIEKLGFDYKSSRR